MMIQTKTTSRSMRLTDNSCICLLFVSGVEGHQPGNPQALRAIRPVWYTCGYNPSNSECRKAAGPIVTAFRIGRSVACGAGMQLWCTIPYFHRISKALTVPPGWRADGATTHHVLQHCCSRPDLGMPGTCQGEPPGTQPVGPFTRCRDGPAVHKSS